MNCFAEDITLMYIYFIWTRDVELTEKLDYSSAVALMGFSLIVAILRTFDVKDEAARVMVAAPLIAFVTTHILYLNFYELDYGEFISFSLDLPYSFFSLSLDL